MEKEYFRAPSINTDDPDNVEIFSLAATVSGDMVANEVSPGIYVINNALTPDEIEFLVNLCKSATTEDWERYFRSELAKNSENGSVEDIDDLTKQNEYSYWFDKSMDINNWAFCEKLIERIRPFFGDKYKLPVITHVHRQKTGEGMDEHSDMGDRHTLLRSMLFYINDDYEGGEVYFPALDFEYKPKAGDFVTFPSYEKYTHGVKPVTSGSHRYALSGFAWQAE